MRNIVAVLCGICAACMCFGAVYAQTNCTGNRCIYIPLAEKPAATSEPSPTPTPSGTVVTMNATAFVPYAGATSVYLVGEVHNETTTNVASVKITAVLRDASDKIVDSGYTYSAIDKLTPGLTSPFRIIFSNPPDWTSYELSVTWNTTADAPVELHITNPETFFDSSNGYHVRGTVKNQTADSRTYVRVFLTLYNSKGKVIGVADEYTNPMTLAPGQEVPFDVDATYWAGEPDQNNVADYVIRAFDD